MHDVDVEQRFAPLNLYFAFAALCVVALAACGRTDGAATNDPNETLSIGFGLTTGDDPSSGLNYAMQTLAVEGLVNFGIDARPEPWLAERWDTSTDGLIWNVWLRPNAKFHDGTPVDAQTVRDLIIKELPAYLGPAFEDIDTIRAVSNTQLEFKLRRRSSFLLEGLEVFVQRPGIVGTGPFYVAKQTVDQIEMIGNTSYHQGPPNIRRITITPYPSVRSAWADMLRGRVDMLYEVGADALNLMQEASTVDLFSFPRPYAYLIILNTKTPALRDTAFRRALNEAIDREALVAQAQLGHGAPANKPVWPRHWAVEGSHSGFVYNPTLIPKSGRISFRCLFVEDADERMALAVQKQLRAVGVDIQFEKISLQEFRERVVVKHDFEAYIASAQMGPNILRQYQFWRSGAAYNWGNYTSREVDAAFEQLSAATSEDDYRAGVAAFQSAIVNDPPAIFLTWTERTRAVTSAFEVSSHPNQDILGTLRLWRPNANAASN